MTLKRLPGILTAADGFQFEAHGLNCFVVPKYLASTCFRPAGRELFYSYLYLYVHYALFDPPDDIHAAVPATEPITAIRRVMTGKLGLDLKHVRSQPDLWQQIQILLDSGSPVLVPVDRAACFYDVEHYGQTPAPTLLLVKGYNPETQVFVVQDWIQNNSLLSTPLLDPTPGAASDGAYTLTAPLGAALPLSTMVGSAYSEFFVLPALLQAWHDAYNQHFDYLQHQLQVMQATGMPRVYTGAEALADIATELELVLDGIPRIIAPKLTMLTRAGTFAGERHMKAKLQFLNSQQVLAHTLASLVLPDGAEPHQGRALTMAGLACWARWRDLVMTVAVMDLQGVRQPATLDALQLRIVEAETAFLYKLYALGTRFSH